jgi:hypothetical protein
MAARRHSAPRTSISRIQLTQSGAVTAGYDAQITVDGADQVIVAQPLQTGPTDVRALAPLLSDVGAMLRTNPNEAFADDG